MQYICVKTTSSPFLKIFFPNVAKDSRFLKLDAGNLSLESRLESVVNQVLHNPTPMIQNIVSRSIFPS